MNSQPILTVRGVEHRFDKTLALQATALDVAENDFITILGADRGPGASSSTARSTSRIRATAR